MSETSVLGAFIIANAVLFLFGVLVTGLSYSAYRAGGRVTSFRNSTIGFGTITLGCIIEPVYQLGIRQDYSISGQELLRLQAMEGTLIAIGFVFLLLSIYSYTPGSQQATSTIDSHVVENDERDL